MAFKAQFRGLVSIYLVRRERTLGRVGSHPKCLQWLEETGPGLSQEPLIQSTSSHIDGSKPQDLSHCCLCPLGSAVSWKLESGAGAGCKSYSPLQSGQLPGSLEMSRESRWCQCHSMQTWRCTSPDQPVSGQEPSTETRRFTSVRLHLAHHEGGVCVCKCKCYGQRPNCPELESARDLMMNHVEIHNLITTFVPLRT